MTAFEAHPDYIRCLAVHPTQPLVLSGSDDMTIRLWDWEKGWKCAQVNTKQNTGLHTRIEMQFFRYLKAMLILSCT